MLKLTGGLVACLAAGTLLSFAIARAQEEKVALDKLPAKVTAAVKAKLPGAELVSAEKEDENGTTIYEVAIKLKGDTIEVSALEDGTIIEVEKLITEKGLPKGVSDAIAAKYAGAKVKKAEEISIITWEVLLSVGDKMVEVKFDGSGKVVEEEQKKPGEDE
jgi:acyl CoA:acetate/3-ketoacid CoA transferase alpha subunit